MKRLRRWAFWVALHIPLGALIRTCSPSDAGRPAITRLIRPSLCRPMARRSGYDVCFKTQALALVRVRKVLLQ